MPALQAAEVRFAARLAWQQTWRRGRRSLGAFLGIAGALTMVLVQLGFQDALVEGAVRLHRQLNGELVVVSRNFLSLRDLDWMSRSGVVQAHAHPQVAAVAPLMLDYVLLRHPTSGQLSAIMAIGVDLDQPALRLVEAREDMQLLRLPGRVMYDRLSRPRYGDILEELALAGRASIQTSITAATLQREWQVVGSYAIGASIAVDGTLLMSEATLTELLGRSRERLTMAVLRLAPGANPTEVAAQVQALLPPALQVLTVAELVAQEQRFWSQETPIGLVFALCTAIGLVICGISIWQLLSQAIAENLQEFAVLRAMGCDASFFAVALLLTAMIHALAALPPALLAAFVVDRLASASTQLEIRLDAGLVGFVAAAGMATALLTGALAALRLRRADPSTLL